MDHFLILTPIFVIAVVSLLRFIGCDVVFGLHYVSPPPPQNLVAQPHDSRVDLTWDNTLDTSLIRYNVKRGITSGNYSDSFSSSTNSYSDSGVTNGTQYFYAVSGTFPDGDSPLSNEVNATPQVLPTKSFVDSVTVGSTHNDFPASPGTKGFLGMTILVGAMDLKVSQLGRYVLPSDTQAHLLKIVEQSSGLNLGTVTVPTAAQPPSVFAFANLASPVTLKKSSFYYIVSEETSGGDIWFSSDTVIATEPDATVTSAVLNDPNADGAFHAAGSVNNCYGPLSFIYVVSP